MTQLRNRAILKKTVQIAASTMLSKLLGLVREVLQVRYFGIGQVADAFRIAWQVPNMLRQVFADGALSAAMVPTVVGMIRNGDRKKVNRLMSLAFLVFEGMVLTLCILVIWKAEAVISVLTPGFVGYRAALTARLLRILMSFILFISSSALLTGVLQAEHHFLIPALSSSFLNIVFIGGLLIGIFYGLPLEYFCFLVVIGGFFQFMGHLFMFFKLGYTFEYIDTETKTRFRHLFKKFLPGLVSGGVLQLSLLVDNFFASFLPGGSVSLLNISSSFLRIPLGLVISFSTVLLPHFSRIGLHAPKRLSFYLLESLKLIFWLTLPATLIFSFFARKIFFTLFLSDKFSLAQVFEAQLILTAFLVGLFFISMNKVLVSLYNALHHMWIPALITIAATGVNIVLCSWWVTTFRVAGLALATSLSHLFQTIVLLIILRMRFNFRLYHKAFLQFLWRYIMQLLVVGIPFLCLYGLIVYLFQYLPPSGLFIVTQTMAFWLWVAPLCGVFMIALYKTRSSFGLNLYFLKR
jgi:putative peptidoglycan lipid II flippase